MTAPALIPHDALETQHLTPPSTKWHRAHGRPSLRQKAANQQLLTPQEEDALVKHVLRSARNGWPVPAKQLPHLAAVVLRARSGSNRQACRPGKNWHLGFYRRHPELRPRRVKAMDWKRHDHSIYDKTVEWFAVIGKELSAHDVLPENVYNMDETGVLLSSPTSLRVLLDRADMRGYRGACSQRTLVTAVECISADGRRLDPLVIWPAASHRSNWTTHPTPGWHFACSETGYTNTAITLYWVQKVFDVQTRERANGRPRILIGDGFSTHHSLEVMTFCYENNIVLCRLPSHTSHKLQPCDVSVFGPLKHAYRQQIEQLFRGGANTIGKQHFTLMYDRARKTALTARNIRAGWSKSGLFPFNPSRVLRDMTQPETASPAKSRVDIAPPCHAIAAPMRTPTSARSLEAMMKQASEVEDSSDHTKCYLEKFANAARKALATSALILHENQSLTVQNNEKKARQATKSTIVGKAKVMSYKDIIEAQTKRTEREANAKQMPKSKSKGEGKQRASPLKEHIEQRHKETVSAVQAISQAGLSEYCGLIDFADVQ